MTPAARDTRDLAASLGSLLLGFLILVGSLLLVAIPLGFLWLISRMGQPYVAVYLVALGGCPAAMIAWSSALLRLNRAYARLTDRDAGYGELLEISIVVAVVLAVVLLAAWLVLYPAGGGPLRGPWPG